MAGSLHSALPKSPRDPRISGRAARGNRIAFASTPDNTTLPPKMQEQPPKYVSSTRMWRSKVGLRLGSLVCLVVIAGLGGSLVTGRSSSFTWSTMFYVFTPAVRRVASRACLRRSRKC
jgi:hypothetical protein